MGNKIFSEGLEGQRITISHKAQRSIKQLLITVKKNKRKTIIISQGHLHRTVIARYIGVLGTLVVGRKNNSSIYEI